MKAPGEGDLLAYQARELARFIGSVALSKKAVDIKILDLRSLTPVTDFFVICSGVSEIQIKAITDAVLRETENEGTKAWHVEGYERLKWVLIDFVDVVVHIFRQEAREFYGLEALWGDAPVEEVDE